MEFGDGLNILTGETGAGKSIIIGSVQIALGGKAPKEMIRRGCDSAYIELVFSIDDERKREQLKEHDVYPDEEGILIISKKINTDPEHQPHQRRDGNGCKAAGDYGSSDRSARTA